MNTTYCWKVLAVALAVSIPVQPTSANTLGVSTRFADIIMERIQPGTLYNLRTMRNLPYRVTNRTDGPVDLQVRVEIPTSYQLKPGYEAVADPSWIRLVPSRLHLAKGEEGLVDVILQTPEGNAYDGRHFQAHIVCETAEPPPGETMSLTFGVAIASRLRFSINSAGPAEIRRLQKKGIYQMLNFTLEPDIQYVPGFVPIGQKVALMSKGIRLSLINRSPQKLDFTVKAVPTPDGMSPPAGYLSGDPSWLIIKPGTLKVAGDSIKSAELDVQLPNDPTLKGKRYMLVVKAGLEGREIPVEIYARVYINVEQ